MSSWLAWVASGHAGVVINELLPDPPGADGGYEWVELHNDGGVAVDLSGWRLEKGTSPPFTLEYTFPPGATLGAGGYVVVGEEFVAGANFVLGAAETLSLGNASSTGDAVRLTDAASNVQDTVVYGANNDDGFLDDLGFSAFPAPRPVQGQTLARVPDGQDTQDSSFDFEVASVATLGFSNDVAVVPCGPGPGVVINELIPNPDGDDAGAEWVELYNPGTDTIDLSGWQIASGTASFTATGALPPGTFIPTQGFLVVAQSTLVVEYDVLAPGFSLGNASGADNGDAVQLRDGQGCPMDTVVYGLGNSDGWLDDLGGFAAPGPVPGSGQSLARAFDGFDSQNSSADFVVSAPTPGLTNLAPGPVCSSSASGLVVNEVFSNPPGADDGFEWIELYHAGSAPIDLTGWAVETASSTTWSARITFGDQDFVQPGQFLLIGGPAVTGRTHDLAGSLGNGTGGDGARVVDCAGRAIDTVVYGGSNDDMIVDDSGDVARSVAPTPPENGSIQRISDGYDTNVHGQDFVVAEFITPGGPNPVVAPIVCVPSAGDIRINEILPDPEGTDDGLEFVELYNAGAAPVSLDGWAISAGTSDFADLDVTLPGGQWIEPGGFYVIGGELVPEATWTTAVSLGNGSSSPDGVRLFDCAGNPVDTVIYGVPEVEPPAEPSGIVDDLGVVAEPYGDAGSGQALFRVADGVDTNAAVDWKLGRATPGATNVVVYDATTTEAPGCGGGRAPSSDAPTGSTPSGAPPNGGCSTVPTPAVAFGLLAAVGLVRRRRHPPASS